MLVAIDTETTLIEDRTYITSASGRKIRTSPFVVPELVCISFADEEGRRGIAKHDPEAAVWTWLHLGRELVFHHFPFDYQVLIKAFPRLKQPLDQAVSEHRVHDTKLLHILLGLATGKYDIPFYNKLNKSWEQEQVRVPSLAYLADHYLGIELPKEDHIRLGFGKYKDRLEDLPEEMENYAIEDARVTLLVYKAMRQEMSGEVAGGIWSWGDLSEPIQVKCSVVFADMDTRGIGVDKELAGQLYKKFSEYVTPLQHQLVRYGLGRWEPKPGTRQRVKEPLSEDRPALDWSWPDQLGVTFRRLVYKKHAVVEVATAAFHLNTKHIQTALEQIKPTNGKRPPRRADGTISLDYEFWKEHVPTDNKELQTWLQHEKLKKILTTYLAVYSSCSIIYPRWNVIGAKTGRTSASSPSIQNVPKHTLGIRGLFLPESGKRWIKADYSYQELITLAEVMARKDIRGPLLETIQSGQDVHTYGASILLQKPPGKVTPLERQGQKVLHFGVPGGLGPAKLAQYAFKTYGLRWSKDEAASRRARFLEKFWDIQQYLNSFKMSQGKQLRTVTGKGRRWWQSELDTEHWNIVRQLLEHPDYEYQKIGEECDRLWQVELPTGRIRKGCRYTEACNTGFQGLAADVSKEALWYCYLAQLEVILFCHDEICIQADPDLAEDSAYVLEKCMKAAFDEICPEVGPYSKVEVTIGDRWGNVTDIEGKELS